jgi:nucleotide-binding universal stress UspA family protein
MKGCVAMSKLKILIPLDGSKRSMQSLDWLKKFVTSKDVEVILFHVIEAIRSKETFSIQDVETTGLKSKEILDKAAEKLEGYKVEKLSTNFKVDKLNTWGYSADLILEEARKGNYDMIIMTKSSEKGGISRIVGSVTHKVVRDSEVAVVVIP